MDEQTENTTPRDWRAVGTDVTDHYNIAEDDRPYIKRIIDVFFYDKNERTYCCELTPSHYMRYLYTFIDFADDIPILDEKIDDLETRYCHEETEDCYIHCSDVDRITEFTATYNTPESSFPDATEEEVREYWQGNCPF